MKNWVFYAVFCITLGCNSGQQMDVCKKMEALPEDSLLTMSGKIVISPKGEYIFDTESRAGLAHVSNLKMELQPCEKITDDFIKEMYEAHLYQINGQSDFWVKVSGRYITPLTFEGTPLFALKSLTLIQKSEVGKVDSSRVVNEIVGVGDSVK